jgi:hypothetical protein
MQTMHRQFGKLMKRSADDSQVSVLLKDFEVADQLLSRVRSLLPSQWFLDGNCLLMVVCCL